MRFFLIEDDAATRRMLERMIEDSELGHVIGQAASGAEVKLDDVRSAEIVLIDLLMPGRDGIETVRALRQEGYEGRFVMISQVENKEMVGEAYLAGVEYFIHKPVNRLEVVAVLKRVADMHSLEQSLSSIRRSLSLLDERATSSRPTRPQVQVKTIEAHTFDLLSRLGIAGEAGSTDLSKLFSYWHQREQEEGKPWRDLPTLKDFYQSFLQAENKNLTQEQMQREIKAMEQRLRRTILQALSNLASIGLTDYANPTFEHFAPRLFDFQEIRLRMQELENGEKTTKCRLNIKKFLTALYADAKGLYTP